MYVSLCLILGYLLGSVSSASIIGRAFGYSGIKNEPDGRISASAVHHNAGLLPFALVVLLDVCLAASAVLIARVLTGSTAVMLLTGLAAVAGHNWSIFLRFKGGLGATAIIGVLIVILTWQVVPGLFVAGLLQIFTHRSGMATLVGISIMAVTAFAFNDSPWAVVSPFVLFIVMLFKKYQVARIAHPAQ